MTDGIGVVGLGVMGRNLALNIAGKGFAVVGFDVDATKRASLAASAGGKSISTADTPDQLAAALPRPRRILMMVPAGSAVDDVIAHLRPTIDSGDILIDGGNSYFRDT